MQTRCFFRLPALLAAALALGSGQAEACCEDTLSSLVQIDEHTFTYFGLDFEDAAQQSFHGPAFPQSLSATLGTGDHATLGFTTPDSGGWRLNGDLVGTPSDPYGSSVGDVQYDFMFGVDSATRYTASFDQLPPVSLEGSVTADIRLVDWNTGMGPVPVLEVNPTTQSFSFSGLIGPGQYEVIAHMHGQSGHLAGFAASNAFALLPVPEPATGLLLMTGAAALALGRRKGRRRDRPISAWRARLRRPG
jgi:hypothetical protein